MASLPSYCYYTNLYPSLDPLDNDGRLLRALRQDCGFFCYVMVKSQRRPYKWRVRHGGHSADFEVGDVESAQAWIRALHYMSYGELDHLLDIRLFDSFHVATAPRILSIGQANSQGGVVAWGNVTAHLTVEIDNRDYDRLEHMYIMITPFHVVGLSGEFIAKVYLKSMRVHTSSSVAWDNLNRTFDQMMVDLDFHGTSDTPR